MVLWPALNWLELLGISLALALIGGALGVTAALKLSPGAGACDSVRVADSVLPSVVTIFVTRASGGGSGSGAIIRADGLILTNDHVIAWSRVREHRSASQRRRAGAGRSDRHRSRSPIWRCSRSSGRTATQQSFARAADGPTGDHPLGAPLGLSGTVTSGIVSALNRNVRMPASGGTTVLTGAIKPTRPSTRATLAARWSPARTPWSA